MPHLLTWHNFFLVYYFGLVLSTCVLNHFRGHWLLNDTLNFIIFINMKFKNKMENFLMDEDASVVLELACLVFQHQKGSSRGFGFLFFLFKEI